VGSPRGEQGAGGLGGCRTRRQDVVDQADASPRKRATRAERASDVGFASGTVESYLRLGRPGSHQQIGAREPEAPRGRAGE
jgi:hypothetical protein